MFSALVGPPNRICVCVEIHKLYVQIKKMVIEPLQRLALVVSEILIQNTINCVNFELDRKHSCASPYPYFSFKGQSHEIKVLS